MKDYRDNLPNLSRHLIPRRYFLDDFDITSIQLHGFSNASELAYAGVVYVRGVDSNNMVHVALVVAKTKVAPIKLLTIPRLELHVCGAVIMAGLLNHIAEIFNINTNDTFEWTDSTFVLGWLQGNPRCFKTFVGIHVR